MQNSNLYQRTVANSLEVKGIGLHSGKEVTLRIRPSGANQGIVFMIKNQGINEYIKADLSNVSSTPLATSLNQKIFTIEHLMASFYAFGIDNALVELDSGEVPILDGSAAPFLSLLDKAGITILDKTKKFCIVKEAVEVIDEKNPDRWVRIEPSDIPWMTYSIDFPQSPWIGKQEVSIELNGKTLCQELSYARTFCLYEDIERMRANGLAMGGSLINALIVHPQKGILNPDGLRHPQEFVRHKALDCLGDLALFGMPIIGHIMAHKAGHDLHIKAISALHASLKSQEVMSSDKEDVAVFEKWFNFPLGLKALIS